MPDHVLISHLHTAVVITGGKDNFPVCRPADIQIPFPVFGRPPGGLSFAGDCEKQVNIRAAAVPEREDFFRRKGIKTEGSAAHEPAVSIQIALLNRLPEAAADSGRFTGADDAVPGETGRILLAAR